MSSNEIPVKPRRKDLEVQIPQSLEDSKYNEGQRKTFNANFNSKRYLNRGRNEDRSSKIKQYEIRTIATDDPVKQKINRNYIKQENDKLIKANAEIIYKFNELEELSVKKITKLREKVSNLRKCNEEINTENIFLRDQSQGLFSAIEDLKLQLELSKRCQSCQEYQLSVENLLSQQNKLKNENKELTEDLNVLKTVVYRLNAQLERYQEKLRKVNIKVSQNIISNQKQSLEDISTVENEDKNFLSEIHHGHTHTPISWGKVNVHTLGPLLDAQQDSINEKELLIKNYERELSNFTGKLKEVITENELLHKSLMEDDESSCKLKVELSSLKNELKTAKEENDILIRKCNIKQDKLEEVLKCYELKGSVRS